MLWISNGAIWVCGPETRAWDFELAPGTTAAGVRFLPGVGPALFGISAADIANIRVALHDVAGDAAEIQLRAEIERASDLDGRRQALEHFVDGLVASAAPSCQRDLDFAERVVNVLASTPRANAAHLAGQLEMTVRQLHRRCLSSFGYGPSLLARLLRLQRFLALLDSRGRTGQSLARLAIESGYSDQPHLARDCRAITGLAPTAFLDEYFPTFPDMSDPYKTAEAFAVTMTA
jgi:AraC-like DNA-binding protein